MASSSSSYCTRWHAMLYITLAVILAAVSISLTPRSDPAIETPRSTTPISHVISLTASRTLRAFGFTVTAALLQISPDLFLSSPNSTIFAIADSHMSNASLPPHLLRNLLKLHTSPARVSIQDLMEMPQGSCLPTVYRNKTVAVTRIDRKNRTVQINRVWVSHPNLFVDGVISIHGVLGPFATVDPDYDVIRAPVCDSKSSVVSRSGGLKRKKKESTMEWDRIVRLLSTKGFVSFAIGLHSVLDRIVEDERHVRSVTIFVPPNLEVGGRYLPRALLEKIVMVHIVPRRLIHRELSALPVRTLLWTMAHDQPLEVTGVMSFMPELVINGVRIVAPEIYVSKKLVVHGIARAFEVNDPPNTL